MLKIRNNFQKITNDSTTRSMLRLLNPWCIHLMSTQSYVHMSVHFALKIFFNTLGAAPFKIIRKDIYTTNFSSK